MALSGSFNTNAVQEGRYYTLSWSATQDINTNSSTISWTLSCAGGIAWYAERTLVVVLAGETVYSKSNRVERYSGNIASGTKIIYHNASGDASFSASIQAAVYTSSVNTSGSAGFTLNTIPRLSEMSVKSGTLGVAQTLSVNRKSSSFSHTITATCANTAVTVCTKSGSTSISFTPPITWSSKNTSGTSVNVHYAIYTYNGNTQIGLNQYDVPYAIPASVIPSCSVSISDATDCFSKYGGYVQGQSKLSVSVSATLAYESPISSYSVLANGSTYSKASFTTGVIRNPGSNKITATVTDKRNRSGATEQTFDVIAYNKPSISYLGVQRCNSDGTPNNKGEFAKVSFSYTITSLDSKNSATCVIKYKKSSETEYTSQAIAALAGIHDASDKEFVFAADSGSSFDVVLEVTDDFATSSRSTSVSTGFTIMNWLASGLGMAIGKVAELSETFEVAWNTKFHKDISVTGNSILGGNLTSNGESRFNGPMYDKYGMRIQNGLALNDEAAEGTIDPNTCLEHWILTKTNVPVSGQWMFVQTIFQNKKDQTHWRYQIAYPYNYMGSLYHRYWIGSWSEWRRIFNADEYMSYNNVKKMKAGTITFKSNNGTTSHPLISDADINSWFGVSNSGVNNTFVMFDNAWAQGHDGHYSASHEGSGNWRVVSSTMFNGGYCRANYLVVYF